VRNFGPGAEKYTDIRYFPVLGEVYEPGRLILGGGLFGSGSPLTLVDGRTQLNFYYVDGLASSSPYVLEKTALNVDVDGVLPYSEDFILRIGRIPANAYAALIKTGSATYSTTAQVTSFLSSVSSFIGECDVSVTLAFE
jgi:hypothetical protein